MSTQRALKRSRVRKGGSQAVPIGLPSLPDGMRGLNHLAGNQAMAALIARRPQKEARRAKDVVGAEPEGEEELAALRLTLDGFEKLMERLEKERDGGRGAYGDLRAWILRVVAALHAALHNAEDYDGDLEELLRDLERLPHEPGEHRLEVLSTLAEKLQANGEKTFGHLSRQLPSPGSAQQKPLTGGALAKDLARTLKREVTKAKREVDADVQPAALGALMGGGGALALRRRKKKRKKA